MARKKQTLQDALNLIDTEESLEGVELTLFSDLRDEDLAEVEAHWFDWPVRLRRRLLTSAGELAEENYVVNFDALARLGLDDPDEDVRVAAVADLWESEDAELIPALLRMLQNDPAEPVRAEAAKSLGRYVYMGETGDLQYTRARRVEDALLGVIAGVDSVEVRRRAVESVAYSSREDVPPIIEAAYRSPDAAWRASAMFAMGRNLDERWVPAILEELRSQAPEMRFEAARAAGEFELESAVSALADLTNDPDHDVQEAAIWSLGQIGGEKAREALQRRRRTARGALREACDDALANAELENMGFWMVDVDEADGEEEENENGVPLN
jgi:HEAT repeat protein